MSTSHILMLAAAVLLLAGVASAADPQWQHLSSKAGDMPVSGTSTQQTAAVVADLDKSGRAGFVLGFRAVAPALVWYRPNGKGNFRKTVFQSGMGFHEVRVADLNGDGRPDILSKPYNWDTPRLDIWLNQGAR